MYLRYIYTHVNRSSPVEYTKAQDKNWSFNTNFISDFFCTNVRKLKIEVADFNFLSVEICKLPKLRVQRLDYSKSLSVYIPFSQSEMDALTSITNFPERMEAYLSLYEQGFYIANEYCNIQVDKLLALSQIFRETGYRYEWLFKKKLIREYNIYVLFRCFFTSIDFTLKLEVYNINQPILLTSGIVFQTAPDRIFFHKEFNKGIRIESDKMYLLDFLDKPNFEFDLKKLSNGIFNVKRLQKDIDTSTLIEEINWLKQV